MANSSDTMDLVFHDPNGNPQVFKLQKAQTLKTAGKPDTIKILTHKPGQITQVVNASGGTIIPGTTPVLRTVTIQGKPRQYVTIPVTSQLQGIIKQANSPATLQTKSIQLPSQSVVVQPQSKTYLNATANPKENRKRKESENEEYITDYVGTVKRRKSDKGGKGLRHFSMKVCEKVRKKGTTSYNEVADELVAEFTNPNLIPNSVDQQYDQKNIRRRVYDALNVLMAMNIIAKEKKEIRWLGLPTTSAQECGSLLNEKKQIVERIKSKTNQLYELLLHQISYKNLVQRNFEMERTRGTPLPNSAIHLPFIVVNSDRQTRVDCSVNNDKTEYRFVFNDKFEICDDFEVLKQIGLTDGLETGAISEENLAKIKSMLPKSMEKYVTKMALESTANLNGFKEGTETFGSDEYSELPGTSASEFMHEEEVEEDETSDDESNISTDVEANVP